MKKKILNILYLFILLQPVIDIITSLMTKFLDTRITLGLVIRGLLFVFSIIYILFLSKSKYKKASIVYLAILLVFALLYFVTKPSILFNKSFILTEVIYMFKYFYTLIMLLALINIFNEFKPNNRRVFKLLQIELFIYCVTIVLANITGTAFATYQYGAGNAGWFQAGNEIGIILTVLFPLIYLLINKTNNFYVLLYVIPIVFAIEIIGTKTSMLGLLLPTIIFFIYYLIRIKKGKWKQFVMTFIILLTILIPTQDLPVIKNMQNSVDSLEKREKIPKNERDDDLTDEVVTKLMFSDRDYFNKKVKKIYVKASITNKFFGIGFVNRVEINDKNVTKLIEMDYNDIFYHYGLIGFILYLMPFVVLTVYAIKLCIEKHFKLNIKQLTLGYMAYVGLGIAFMVGHTLGAPGVAIHVVLALVLLIYYLKYDQYVVELEDDKVTILALHLGTGGVEKYISDLCKMLENKFRIEVVSTYKISNKPAFKFSNKIEIKYLINDYPHKEEFRKSIKDKNIINIIKYGYSLAIMYGKRYILNVLYVEELTSKYVITTRYFHNKIVGSNKNRDIVAIATEHNYHNNNNKYIRKLVDSCNNFDYLVLVSKDLKKFYENRIDNIKCVYIPNVIDNIGEYKKKSKINNKLISVGRLEYEKGFNDLIDIISIVKKNIPNISLDIYGDGSLKRNLNKKIKELGLEENIVLKGNVKHDVLINIYSDYDIYTMSSYTESFGIVLLEAMSQSVVCIAFNSANGANMLLSNGNGILIKDRDINEYAKTIVELLNNKDRLNNISGKAYSQLKEYDIENVKKSWLKLMNDAVRK